MSGRVRLSGRTAIVTGASGGLGRCFAEQLAARGAALVLTARREAQIEELAAGLRARFHASVKVLPLDLARAEAPAYLFEATEGAGVRVDVLVNNAGRGVLDRFLDAPPESAGQVLGVNVVALTELCRLFGGAMRARRAGYILNVGSAAAFVPAPNLAVYAASKAYVRSFSEAIAHELRGDGVRVCCVSPSGIDTGFWETATPGGTRGMTTGGMAPPEEIARHSLAALFSGRSSLVPGRANRVNELLVRMLPRSFLIGATAKVLARGLPPDSRQGTRG